MGYWLRLEVNAGGEHTVDVFEANFTRNITPMWYEALGKHLRDYHGTLAADAIEPLTAGIDVIESDRERFEAMNPANGWGDTAGALQLLRDLRDACRAHPATTIRVSG